MNQLRKNESDISCTILITYRRFNPTREHLLLEDNQGCSHCPHQTSITAQRGQGIMRERENDSRGKRTKEKAEAVC